MESAKPMRAKIHEQAGYRAGIPKTVGKECLGEKCILNPPFWAFSSPICGCIEVSTHVKLRGAHIPILKMDYTFSIHHWEKCTRWSCAGSPDHPRNSVPYKSGFLQSVPINVEVFLLQLWIKELHFRLRHLVAKHQRWVQILLTAWIKISPKTNVPTTGLHCKHHSIIHMLPSSTLTSQGHVFLFECRWPCHLSAEIPSVVFKHLKSGLCFYWR